MPSTYLVVEVDQRQSRARWIEFVVVEEVVVDWRRSQRRELEGRQRFRPGSFIQLSRSGAASNTQQGPSPAAYRPLANGKLNRMDPLCFDRLSNRNPVRT